MDVESKINEIFQDSKQFLSIDDCETISNFLEHREFLITIEYICDLLIDNLIPVSEELGRKIQDIAEFMCLDPERTWDFMMIRNNDQQNFYRLATRDNADEVFRLTVEVYQEVNSVITDNDKKEIDEYLNHEEYELAIDVICSALIEDKRPISRELLRKIKNVFTKTQRPSDTWTGFVVRND